jgi:acetyl/propionyl-CoA carboxylase alpha subunit
LPGGPGVRVDSGLYEGLEVTPHYDPMLAKLSVHAPTRELAIARMARALSEVTVTGVITNLPFLRRALDSEPFRTGRYDTGTIEGRPELFAPTFSEARERQVALIAATMAHVLRRRRGLARTETGPDGASRAAPGQALPVPPARRGAWRDAFRPGAP